MKRKILAAILVFAMCISTLAIMTGCNNASVAIASGEGAPTESVQGDVGSLYVDTDKGDLYQMTDGGWTLLAGLKGETGAQGEKGEKGEVGAQGEKGEAGEQGMQGEAGPKGDKGDTGEAGAPGEKGDTGVGIQNVETVKLVENGQTYLVITVTYTDANKPATVEKVLISDPYIEVTDTASAQAALDAAKAGDTIKLAAGDYGVLYLRQSEMSKRVDVSDWAGNGDAERYRKLENITILGGEGVNVEAIKIEAATYPGADKHSNGSEMPYLISYMTIKNLTVKGINFVPTTDGAIFDISSGSLEVDGLYIDDCTLTYADTTGTATRLVYQGSETVKEIKDKWNDDEVFMVGGSVQNISITNCTVKDAHQVIELRNAKNITISGNTFENIRERDILLAMGNTNQKKFSGTITITNNTSKNSSERFFRVNGVKGTFIVSGNTIIDSTYEESYAKITNHEGSYVEFTNNTWNGLSDAEAKAQSKIEK